MTSPCKGVGAGIPCEGGNLSWDVIMKFYPGLNSVVANALAGGCVLTIGNFDGMHLGHRALIDRARKMANALGCPLALMTFDPHPMKVLHPSSFEPLIFSNHQKRTASKALGVDLYVEQPFDRDFFNLTPLEFIEEVLIGVFNIQGLVVGSNYRFGARAHGNMALLNQQLKLKGILIGSPELVEIDQTPVSSSRIRGVLKSGDVAKANALLGSSYKVEGKVIHGSKRGREIGFPTANIQSEIKTLLPNGVYATWFSTLDPYSSGASTEGRKPSVTNIGTRPTVDGISGIHIESHLLEGAPDLYGKKSCLSFVKKIRDEKKFENVDSLKRQISLDIESARIILSRVSP